MENDKSCLQKGMNVRATQTVYKDVEAAIFISSSVVPWSFLSRETPYSWYRKTLNEILKGLAEKFSDTSVAWLSIFLGKGSISVDNIQKSTLHIVYDICLRTRTREEHQGWIRRPLFFWDNLQEVKENNTKWGGNHIWEIQLSKISCTPSLLK